MARHRKGAAVPGRIGVLLVNTGTPDEPTPRAVRRYLSKFLMDKRIRPMNPVGWWLILHLCILPKRGVASAEKYRAIWTDEGSPLAVAQAKLARGLDARFADEGRDVVVRQAMSYGRPTEAEAVRELREAGCSRLVVLPLYPQSAFSTTGAVTDGVSRALRRVRWDVPCQVIEDYHDDPVYARALAAAARNAGFDPSPESDDRLLFSFHSIPLADIEAGDTYELQAGASSLAIAGELGIDRRRWTIGYQCRFDKGRTWLSPFTKGTLATWAETSPDPRVFLMCPNFAIDCLETLYDVDYEIAPAYRAAGGRSITFVPCLNSSKAHLKVLAHVLEPYLG
ncbi:MAG: ferrochelatase [Eggerthellaceae bacterium]|nr:ferrochelatase [Eggerthellaceae bacterium]